MLGSALRKYRANVSYVNFVELSVAREGATENKSEKHSYPEKEEEKEETAAVEKVYLK